MEKNILKFNSYLNTFSERINENETSIKTISQIISAYTKLYMFLVSKAPDYGDVVTDLIEVNEEKDPAKRAEKMTSILNKVAEKVDGKYADVKTGIKDLSKKIGDLFSSVASTDDAKGKKEVIDKAIATQIFGYRDIAKKASANESKQMMGKNHVLMFERFTYPLLFEKKTFEDEREDLVQQMKPTYTEMQLQKNNPSTDTLKAKAEEVVKRFDEITKLLKTEEEWENMKNKKARKAKIEELGAEIAKTSEEVSKIQKDELFKIGIEKKTAEDLSSIITGIEELEKKAKVVDDAVLAKAGRDTFHSSLKVGDIVKYKKDDGSEGEEAIYKIVGTGDEAKYTFKDKEGNLFAKTGDQLISKVEKKEGEKKEEKKKEESFKLEKTIKATGNSPKGEELDQTKKIFEMICDKFSGNDKISGMDEWGKSNFCKPNKFYIGQSRTAVIKAIKEEYELDAENGDLTPELVAKLTA